MAIIEATTDQGFPSRTPDPTNDELTELLTVREAARVLKVTVSWIYEHVRPEAEDPLPVVKLGKYLRFDPRDLQTYINAKRDAARQAGRRR